MEKEMLVCDPDQRLGTAQCFDVEWGGIVSAITNKSRQVMLSEHLETRLYAYMACIFRKMELKAFLKNWLQCIFG
ncbi:hypothetical protein [Labilibaculum euxinus]|uniref:Uncharacterized protein n=1 Tax=Labilibaculum euxinus TaxID=2686357 RepID=A0A7M4DBG9_9BACT|nr:hypothetical protein [Labilibaculum euxinus]MUP39998.1 hypothetical protein [Labilibaculum euxinus]MVB09203.1 hypothetical protein [Labilibaculum euxinus]